MVSEDCQFGLRCVKRFINIFWFSHSDANPLLSFSILHHSDHFFFSSLWIFFGTHTFQKVVCRASLTFSLHWFFSLQIAAVIGSGNRCQQGEVDGTSEACENEEKSSKPSNNEKQKKPNKQPTNNQQQIRPNKRTKTKKRPNSNKKTPPTPKRVQNTKEPSLNNKPKKNQHKLNNQAKTPNKKKQNKDTLRCFSLFSNCTWFENWKKKLQNIFFVEENELEDDQVFRHWFSFFPSIEQSALFFLLNMLWSRHVKPSSAKGEKRLKRK